MESEPDPNHWTYIYRAGNRCAAFIQICFLTAENKLSGTYAIIRNYSVQIWFLSANHANHANLICED